MQCPHCHSRGANLVTDSRTNDDGTVVRRRRQCRSCGARFTTYETATNPAIVSNLRTQCQDLAGTLARFGEPASSTPAT